MNTRLQVQRKTTPKSSFTPLGRSLLPHRSTKQAESPLVPPILHDMLPKFQAKLTIGQPNDQYEQEADRVADQVMRMPEPKIQRVCPECQEELQRQPMENEEEEEETLQTKPLAEQITPLVQRQTEPMEEEEDEMLQTKTTSGQTPTVSSSLQNRITALRGGGQPLPQSERAFFEPRFGTDFSLVRVHEDREAAETASEVNARAFTLGSDIVFGRGQYQPDVSEGRRLLAHELTHVIQQSGRGNFQLNIQRSPDNFITAIFVDLTRQTVSWIYDNGMVSATHQCSTGAGRCDSDCSSPGPGSACTPVGGPFPICSRRPHRTYRYFVGFNCDRAIGFHYYSKVDGCPWSHGCVRLHKDAIDLIYQGARRNQTLVYVSGTPNLRRCWTSSTGGRCWRRERANPKRRTNLRCAWHDCWDIGDFPTPPPNIRVV